jgi:DNA-binding transcriptional MerR regulator
MLTIHQVAVMAGLHRDTVRRLDKRGVIASKRDVNGWRRYSPAIVEQLKALHASDEDGPEPKRAA